MTKAKTPVRISPSGLGAFYTCPKKYYYQKRWRAKKVDQGLQDGIDTHLLMQGKKLAQPSTRATQFYHRLKKLMLDEGYVEVPRWKEKQREVVSPDGSIVIQQTIDTLAHKPDTNPWKNRVPVVVDYKTSGYPWWTSDRGGITPKAEGTYQAVAYLIPTEKLPKSYPFKNWPTRIDFLNVPEVGRAGVYSYELKDQDISNLWEAAEMALSAKVFPLNRGYHCRYCPFFDKCFGQEKPGQYYRREDGPLEADDL